VNNTDDRRITIGILNTRVVEIPAVAIAPSDFDKISDPVRTSDVGAKPIETT
jgi:hypothetical protein